MSDDNPDQTLVMAEQDKNHLRWLLSSYRMVYDGIIDRMGNNKRDDQERLEQMMGEIQKEKKRMR